MNLISFNFLLFMLLAAPLLRLSAGHGVRSLLLLGLNALFLASFWGSLTDALPVLGMVLLGYGFTRIVAHQHSYKLLALFIAVLVVLFIWLKQYAFFTGLWPSTITPFMVVGLSYILFRVLHVLIDVAQRDMPAPPFLSYLNYCLFFLSFVSGPIQRFKEFDGQIRNRAAALTVPVLHHALWRILLGITLIIGLSALFASAEKGLIHFFTPYAANTAKWRSTMPIFAMISLLELCKLYFNFAGSMHLVIGLGTLAGITLPENFNKPYQSKNFLDFWARWHITLSQWIKYYVFNPLLGFLIQRFSSARGAYYSAPVAFFVAFTLIGIWHGSSWLFLLFGLMLGLGATITILWQQGLTRRLSKKRYLALCARSWYAHSARGLTLAYVAVALICLWLEPATIRAMGLPWLASMMIVGIALLSVVIAVISGMLAVLARLIAYAPIRLPSSARMMPYSMALMIWLVLNLVGAFGSGTPEFIYKAF